jgi:glycosyltransferase involved in cell wall biosynthesis
VTAKNGDSEGFGIVFAEAQACATPVVSFSTGGIPEAVAHGETGLLAPEGDWQSLASHLLLLLQNSELRMGLGFAGRRRVVSQFDLCKQTAVLEDLYDHAVVGSLPSRRTASSKSLGKELEA